MSLRLLLLLLLGACTQPANDDDATDDDDSADDDDATPDDDDDATADDDDSTPSTEGLSAGDAVICETPVAGFDRLSEDGVARGLSEVLDHPGDFDEYLAYGEGGDLVLEDLDADGDLDLVFPQFTGAPKLYRNDGEGQFEAVTGTVEIEGDFRSTGGGALDLDGDGLPELLLLNGNELRAWRNEGDLDFGESWTVHAELAPPRLDLLVMAWSDFSGDGWVDLFLASGAQGGFEEPVPENGAPDLLFLGSADGFSEPRQVIGTDPGTILLVALPTDYDQDGRVDLFLPTDLGHPSNLWHNTATDGEGWPVLEDEAPALGADLVLSAMGADGSDLNRDGLPDYCITDVGRPVCLLSSEFGYVESAAALGVLPASPVGPDGTVGWSFDFADLDNDGWDDALQASGPFPEEMKGGSQEEDLPDLVWQGEETGFTDRTAMLGFGDVANHVGLATGDVNGDGFLDVVLAGPGTRPKLWMNECGDGAWIEVHPRGPEGNSQGFGLRVEVEVGADRQVREIAGMRGQAQGPSRVHIGLGTASSIDRLTVTWPDGVVQQATDVGVSRVVTATHPDAP